MGVMSVMTGFVLGIAFIFILADLLSPEPDELGRRPPRAEKPPRPPRQGLELAMYFAFLTAKENRGVRLLQLRLAALRYLAQQIGRVETAIQAKQAGGTAERSLPEAAQPQVDGLQRILDADDGDVRGPLMAHDERPYPPTGSNAYPPTWTTAEHERRAAARACSVETCFSARMPEDDS